jgi:hypothetical protein
MPHVYMVSPWAFGPKLSLYLSLISKKRAHYTPCSTSHPCPSCTVAPSCARWCEELAPSAPLVIGQRLRFRGTAGCRAQREHVMCQHAMRTSRSRRMHPNTGTACEHTSYCEDFCTPGASPCSQAPWSALLSSCMPWNIP